MNIRKHFLLSILVAFSLFVRAQDRVADSLLKVITSLPVDTPRVNKLNDLSWHFRGSSPKETMKYGLEAKAMAEKIHYLKGLARAYKNIGISHYFESKYVEALQSWTTAMELYDSTSDKTGVANMLNNIGSVFYSQGSEIKALDYFLKSLRISEELNDTLRIASSLGSIANVYLEKKQTHDKALVYFYKALPLAIAIRDSNIIGSATVGIGEIYLRKCEAEPLLVEKGYLDTALFYFNKSLNAYTGTEAVIYSLNDIGKVFLLKEDYAKAVEYHNRAYALAGEKGNKLYMSQSLLGLGNAYAKQENYKAALTSFKQAERISADNETKYELKKAYEGLAANYSKLSDYINAFRYQVLLTTIKDSIYSIESDKKLGSLQFDFDIQKKQGEINLLTKDKEIQEQVIQRQRLVRNGFIGGFAVMVLFASIFFRQRNRISKEKKRSDELLLNILPEETAEELKLTGTARAKSFDQVTVMFTDFKNFTQASELLSPEELVHEINHCYSEFDKIITRHGIEKIKTIGDAYMCAGGLPVVNETHAFDVIHAGLEFQKFIAENKKIREAQNQPYFELRLGIHTGPVVAGIVGIKKFAYDIWGDTVNTASRMESSGEIGKVNISGVTYELVKDKFHCHYRGKVKAKNKGEIDMYFVEAPLA